ncbi:MAG: PEP-CTERM sorting domain-containing protein [Sedimentisphaerales bacterium]
MKKTLGVLMLCTFLLTIGSTAEATKIWVSGNTGNWSDPVNWGGTLPGTTETAQVNNGHATLDATQTIGQLLMGAAATDVGVLDINTGANLTVSKNSAELIGMVKASGASSTINHSAGTVSVYSTGYAGTGETRLVTASTTTGTAIYNLSGTAVLDTEVLSKGNKNNSNAQFNATGGTLVIRNMIYRFGLISENGVGFNQGLAKLEIGAVSTVKSITMGNGTNSMDYTVGTGGTLVFDIGGASSYDKVLQYGNLCNTAGATLNINLLEGYTPDVGSFFDVWTFSDKSKAGSGLFASVPTNWTASWVDTSPVPDGSTDTLRLTYTPEPATIALLSLGLIAIRRKK